MTLHILHEGIHDKKFFETFLKNDLLTATECKKLKPYKYKTDASAQKYIKTIKSRGDKFLIFGDADFQNTGTLKPKNYTELHKHFCSKFAVKTNCNKLVFVVVEEIESWYLAGFDKIFCKKNNVKYHANTENVTAEIFAKSRIRPEQTEDQFRNWLLKNNYSVTEASKRNKSFKRFYDVVLKKT